MVNPPIDHRMGIVILWFVRHFEKSFSTNRSELFPPFLRYRRSTVIYPHRFRSSTARLTVDLEIFRSIAIVRSDGQH